MTKLYNSGVSFYLSSACGSCLFTSMIDALILYFQIKVVGSFLSILHPLFVLKTTLQ